jgi:uncharacterized membrane protein required for colicin V production
VEQALHFELKMIRAVLGFLILFGVVGTLDADHHVDLIILTIIAAFGTALLYSGVSSIKFEE